MLYLVALLWVVVFTGNSSAQAQNKQVIDSLDRLLAGARDTTKVNVLNSLAWEYRTSEHTRAIEYALHALGIAEQLRYKRGMARAYNTLGLVYRRRGNHPQSLEYHLKSLKVSEEIGDSLKIAQALNNIGLLYLGQSNYAQALEYFERALSTHEKNNNAVGVASAMENIGAIYSRQGRYSQSLEHLMKALAIFQQYGKDDAVAETIAEVATLYSRQGNYEFALQDFQRALKLMERVNNKSAIAQILSNIAAIYHKTGDTAKAESSALQALAIARSVGEIEWIKESSNILSAIYKAQSEYQKALEYHALFTSMKDSITGEESIRKIADLEAILASEKRQAQIDILTKEKQLQVLISIALSVGVALLFLLAYVLFRSNHRQKKNNELLSEQNREILRQQQLLEEQAREIEMANAGLQEMNFDLQHQQKLLEEQAREIDLINNELLERSLIEEEQKKELKEQRRQIEITNEELQERNIRLRELDEQKDEFLAIAAHDLKNPLVSIVMSAGTIKRYYQKLAPEDILEAATRIETTAGRMRQIIINLLDLNAIESGKFEMSPEPVSPGEVVERAVEEWQNRAAEKSITVQFQNRAREQVMNADPQALHQILDNLISNAVKYSERDTTVRVRLSELVKHEEQPLPDMPQGVRPEVKNVSYARLEVQDQGPGLSAEDKAKLFGKFARLSARPTGGEHSTGLGLSIVKKMVEAMNGAIWCESEPGKGATFIVELPTNGKH